jgi:hypothetical protein
LAGSNNGPERAGKSPSYNLGYGLGREMREEAENYRANRKAIGSLGGRPNNHKVNHVVNHKVYHKVNHRVYHMGNPINNKQNTKRSTTIPLTGNSAPIEKKLRKPKYQSEDITPENGKYLAFVYQHVPKNHPITQEPVPKGAYAEAARVFQSIVDSGEATGKELYWAGRLYYEAEELDGACGGGWLSRINQEWDYRKKFMMHVSTFYGPTKRLYRQFLPMAKEFIRIKESQEVTV